VGTRHLIRSVFALGIAQIVTWLSTAVLAVVLPRYLGDVNLGKLAFALAITSLAGLAADLGIGTYLTKEIARSPERASTLTTNALAMRIPLILLATGLAIGVVGISDRDDVLTAQIVYALCGMMAFVALGNVVGGALQGLQRIRVLAVSSVLPKVTLAAATVVILSLGGGALEFATASAVTSSFGILVGGWVLFRRAPLTMHFDWKLWRSIFLGGLPFFVWQAALLVYGQIDTVMLSFMAEDAVVGWYAAAYRLISMPVFVPTIVMMVVFPALSAATSDPQAYRNIAQRAVRSIALISVPMALGIMLLADKIIGVFGYPAGFQNSIWPMLLLAPHIPLAGIDMMIGTVLNTRDRQRQWALTGVTAAVLNPLVNLVAIPLTQSLYGNGAIGAAAVTTLTEVFMMVVGLRLLPGGVFDRSTVTDGLKCVLAGLIMSVVVYLNRDLPIAVPVVLGVLVYGGACWALGALSLRDLHEVRVQLLQREAVPSVPG
jgi:O-antigen/teichoic acid export membrane protein